MNWNAGLKRVSLVWWGFWFLLTLIVGISFLVDGGGVDSLKVLIGTVATVVLHKVTCWVIDGFTRS